MLENCLKNLPETPGIYIFWGKGQPAGADKPIYVGKAVNIKKRLESYFRLNLAPKTAKMLSQAESVSFIKVDSELEALLLEAKLIKRHQPKYNFIAKDDKHPLYIVITNEKYPRVVACRKPYAVSHKHSYGPFPSSAKVYSTLRMLRSEKYAKNIKNIKQILDGKIRKVIAGLTREMKQYSGGENYEEAARVKAQIENLKYITQKSLPEDQFLKNPNLAADLRTAELKNLKEMLIKNFKLSITNCTRIECYDVSHLSGTFPTASMVTFVNGEPDKSLYRRFRLLNPRAQSDTDSLKEVAQRRLKYLTGWGKPDLILVDGGRNQIAAFSELKNKLKIPVIGIAKSEETLITASLRYRLPEGPAKNLIVRLRNESHRFARKYHDLLVKKDLFTL